MHLRTYSNRYKTLLVLLISFSLYFNGFSTAYAASLGGWTLGGSVVNGASVILNGSKELILNGASKIANGTAKITPTAAQVSKALAGGAAAVALDLAIKELLGAVDYVLDPANNSITYQKPASSDPTDPAYQYYYVFSLWGANQKALSVDQVCLLAFKAGGWAGQNITSVPPGYYCSLVGNSIYAYGPGGSFGVVGSRVANPAYDPAAADNNQPKSLPLSTISNQVISMAEGGNASAQQAIKAAADTIVAEAETDSTKARPIVSQFENTSTIETSETATSTSETTTANPADTATTDTTTEFPVFCSWAPTICQAANVVIQKPSEWAENIKAAYDDAVDYFKEDPSDAEQETPDIPDPTLDLKVTNYIQGTSVCPQDREIPLSMGGKTLNLVISYQPLCSVAEMFKPAVILMAFLAGAFIITNTGRRAETGD